MKRTTQFLALLLFLLPLSLAFSANEVVWNVTIDPGGAYGYSPIIAGSGTSDPHTLNKAEANTNNMENILSLAKLYLSQHGVTTLVLEFPAGEFYFDPKDYHLDGATPPFGAIYLKNVNPTGRLIFRGAAPPMTYDWSAVRAGTASEPAISVTPPALTTRLVNVDTLNLSFNTNLLPDQLKSRQRVKEMGSMMLFFGCSNITVENFHFTRPAQYRWEDENGTFRTQPGLFCTQGTIVGNPLAAEYTGNQIKKPGALTVRIDDGYPDPKWLIKVADADGMLQEKTLLPFTNTGLAPLAGEPQVNPVSGKVSLYPKNSGSLSPVLTGAFPNYTFPIEDPEFHKNLEDGMRVALKTKFGRVDVRLRDCDDCVVEDVLFTRAAGVPILVNGFPSNGVYGHSDGNIFRRVVIDRANPGLPTKPFYSGPGGGIQVYSGADGPLVEDCTVIGTADDGIAVFSDVVAEGAYPYPPTAGSNNLRRNAVLDNQGRGILISQTESSGTNPNLCRENLLVRNNVFSIYLRCDEAYKVPGSGAELRTVKDWKIEDNVIVQPGGEACIGIKISELLNADSEVDGGKISDISFEGNKFRQASRTNNLFLIEDAIRVTISRNVIESFSAATNDYIGQSQGTALVYTASSTAITGTANVIADVAGAANRPARGAPPFQDLPNVDWSVTLPAWPAGEGYILPPKNPTGALSDKGNAIQIGDDEAGTQLRAYFAFDSSALPDGSAIQSARLRLTQGHRSSLLQFSGLGNAMVDAKTPYFGSTADLKTDDYGDTQNLSRVGSVTTEELKQPLPTKLAIPLGELPSGGYGYIDKSGKTHFRLMFTHPHDSDGTQDRIGFYSSGGGAEAAPKLEVIFR